MKKKYLLIILMIIIFISIIAINIKSNAANDNGDLVIVLDPRSWWK